MKAFAQLALLALFIYLASHTGDARSLAGNSAKQVERASEKTKAPAWDFDLLDAAGRRHTAREWKDARAVALFFIATECPISNRYAPEINRIVAAYSTRGVAFYGVHSDPDVGAAVARQHARDYGFDFPMLLDPTQTLANRTGVNLTPTAVILSPAGELLYRGRIDNRYLDFGKYRDAGVKPDLRLALDALIAGKLVAEKYTKTIGCALPPPGGQSARRQAQ
jgi:peroxiredoxin